MKDHSNLFIAIANALWNSGEDGEDIALGLALAFQWVHREAFGDDPTVQNPTVQEEFSRLLKTSQD